jgi:hypothetical protein
LTVFTVTTGTGSRFIPGAATENGYACNILSIAGDQVTLSAPLPYLPVTADEFVQTIIGQKDKVRLLTGDTDTTDQQLQDEEIDLYLQLKPNPMRAAALAAEGIAGKLARAVDYEIYQELKESMGQASRAYFNLADRLRLEAARSSTLPIMGGLLQADKDFAVADLTKVKPFFTREQMQEPGTEPSDSSLVGYRSPYY